MSPGPYRHHANCWRHRAPTSDHELEHRCAARDRARHATAHQVRIVVRQEPNRLLLNIQDDGQGFDASRIRGLGLVGMAERVAHLGGDFAINSKPGRGTVLRVDLPLETAPTVEAR